MIGAFYRHCLKACACTTAEIQHMPFALPVDPQQTTDAPGLNETMGRSAQIDHLAGEYS